MTALSRDLGGGLLLRAATAADTDALATFNADVWYPDCLVRTSETRALLNALPRQPSFVWPVL